MMIFKYAENKTCSCGTQAVYEISDDNGAVFLCNECMTQVASGFFGIGEIAKITNSDEAMTKPDDLFKDIGDISFEREGEVITVDPFVCSDYSPALYFRNSKKYVAFSWNNLLDIAINLGAAKK